MTDALPGLVDLHCHLVPGVDDGAPRLEDALRYLDVFADRGIDRVATTPHLPARLAGSPYRREVEESFRGLREATSERGPDVELSLAYEVRLDGTRVDPGDRGLWLGPGGHVLVEFSMLSLPSDPEGPLRTLLEDGLIPVLAHPERYRGLNAAYGWVGRWREMGVRLCLNAGSVWGVYGRQAEELSRRMLEAGEADLVGSDHHARPRRADDLGRAWDELTDRYPDGGPAIRRLLSDNPRAVLDGGATEAVPPLEGRPSDMTLEGGGRA